MKRFIKWIVYFFLGCVVLMILAGIAKNDPETALGIAACILAMVFGLGLRRALRWKKQRDNAASQGMVMGQMMANNPLEDIFHDT